MDTVDYKPLLQRALVKLRELQAKIERLERPAAEPLAIIGMSCRFPGGANDLESYWHLLEHGIDAIREIPPSRWDIDAYYDPDPDAPGKMYCRCGGFLDLPIDGFDAAFFGISPREAIHLDPQQRLLLEVAWEALEHAGQAPERLAGSSTGVYLGISTSDYAQLQLGLGGPAGIDAYTGTGTAFSVAAGRLSYYLGLQGPNVPLDTACSSSLVAVHLACRSLRSRECDLALAGGVNLMLIPDPTIYFCRLQAMAPDGRCKTFDARADGYVRGEGCGMVVLKRLSDALRDRDPILALVRGSAVNHDGRSTGLTVPNGLAQQAVIRRALADGRVEPHQVSYVEAHGTGTALGDPIEVEALHAVLGAGRDRKLLVGSVKTNIGHLEASAGIAGLIKLVLALRQRRIPPHLHFRQGNPYIPWDAIRVAVPVECLPWDLGTGPRIAGLSSFGFSGTNAHVVVEEAPAAGAEPGALGPGAQLVPISARSEPALRELAQAYVDRFGGSSTDTALADLAYTAAVRRSHHDWRLALVARSTSELVERLRGFLAGEIPAGLSWGYRPAGRSARIAFVFSGQGSQWLGMGTALLAEPAFREALEACDRVIAARAGWSVVEELSRDSESARFDRIEVIQPVLFSLQVALSALWRSWGIEPDAVVGQSMGEVAAAQVAGALTLEDASAVIVERSVLLAGAGGGGGLAVVELPFEQVAGLLRDYPQIALAGSSSPSSSVVAGSLESLTSLLAELERREVFARWIKADVASHSPQMEPLLPPLRQRLAGLRPQSCAVPMVSTVRGQRIDGATLAADYWASNLREPFLMTTAVERLLSEGVTLFVEISPHPVLLPAIEDSGRHAGRELTLVPSLLREQDERGSMLAALGAVYAQGGAVAWSALHPGGGRCVHLPNYPWQRERFWIDVPRAVAGARPGGGRDPEVGERHPLIGRRLQPASHPGVHVWQTVISVAEFPYLADHQIQGEICLPGSFFIRLIQAAAEDLIGAELYGAGWAELELRQALFLPPAARRVVQTIAVEEAAGGSVAIYSRPIGAEDAPWTLHAQAHAHAGGEARAAPGQPIDLSAVQARGMELDPALFYQRLQASGNLRGPSFQVIERLWIGVGEVLAALRAPAGLPLEPEIYQGFHPALMHGWGQTVEIAEAAAAGLDRLDSSLIDLGAMMGTRVERLRFYSREPQPRWSYATVAAVPETGARSVTADLRVLDDHGRVVMEALAVTLTFVDREAAADRLEAPAPPGSDHAAGRALRAAGPEARQELLVDYLRRQVGAALKLPADRVDPQLPWSRLGLDSLMALRLKKRIEADLQVVLPVAKLLRGPNVLECAAEILVQLEDVGVALEPSRGET